MPAWSYSGLVYGGGWIPYPTAYNHARYLSFLTRVEALTSTQRETIDDANPLAAYPTGAPVNWMSVPSSGGQAADAAYWRLVSGRVLALEEGDPDDIAIWDNAVHDQNRDSSVGRSDVVAFSRGLLSFSYEETGSSREAERLATLALLKQHYERLRTLAMTPRVFMGFERAAFAALLADFTDFGTARSADATTVYAPVESLIPFASL